VAKKNTPVSKNIALFLSVMEVFARIQAAHPLRAMNYSPASKGGPTKLAPDGRTFVIDVINALKKIPTRDRTLLILIYGSNAFEDDLKTATFAERVFHGRQEALCNSAGNLLAKSGLDAKNYFKFVQSVPAGVPYQTVQPKFTQAPTPAMSEREVKARYAQLRAKQFAVQVPEPIVVEPTVEDEDIETQELNAVEIERSVTIPQWDDVDTLIEQDPFARQDEAVEVFA
jgi:hypothetical protein